MSKCTVEEICLYSDSTAKLVADLCTSSTAELQNFNKIVRIVLIRFIIWTVFSCFR